MSAPDICTIAVIDIGKTNAKVALVDGALRAEIAIRKMPNVVRRDGPYPHFDAEALWRFIVSSLADLNRERAIDAISVTTHGAAAVLLRRDGSLALPILDYEHDGPDETLVAYGAVRPDFTESGSPPLPVGLNLGAQIFWQSQKFASDFAAVAQILTYPQYWAYLLCGVAANEVSSLGAHTDLWNPHRRDYSSLVDTMGWRSLLAPLRPARTKLASLAPELAQAMAMRSAVPVFCGIHDSNASLLSHLDSEPAPFAVVSTGTWVISMAVGGPATGLDPARDTLINVNANGDAVPSARFMGGRELEILTQGEKAEWTGDDVGQVLNSKLLFTPSAHPGSGPFSQRSGRWHGAEKLTPARRHVASSFYLALMTSVGLDLISAQGDIIVEGPFAANQLYLEMLATASARNVRRSSDTSTGASIGAALLALPPSRQKPNTDHILITPNASWQAYVEAWHEATSHD
jgi:sugar (pentulose or hexulose) kinase